MKIVVCIKQVPDTTDVKINKETNTLIREGVKSIINPFDMYAIEEGLRLREKYGGTVTVISMGPPQVTESLKEAVSLGVDDVILLSDRVFAGADTLATSYTLAKGIEKIGGVDLILCGKQAIDGDTAQVGPGIAEHLDIPHVTYVKEITDVTDKIIRVKRMIEGGYEEIEMDLPALLTVVKEINEPRLPSIRGILRSREMEVPIWTAQDLDVDEDKIGLNGSPTQVVSITTPKFEAKTQIFTGKVEEQVQNLFNALREQRIL
ncbi:electron transfer flavoprotein subunit beta [Anoxybacter fermentans]|uniref:Electron transfer flavoprotein small subunit n=1 Tax=Anoxybacter fermentans TaxID=1323375 RepID=A0A3S9SWX8_9FIRM|nr:electron transfer flavoprotein subunit beta/FixA family protein [Anoxybacter fermentans]AZR72843.1 electron transfer flavoprotein subunit beta [Anoxybacter fermentans]